MHLHTGFDLVIRRNLRRNIKSVIVFPGIRPVARTRRVAVATAHAVST